MDFYILNRQRAVQYSHAYKNETMAIISITDPNSELNIFHDSIPENRILRLEFDDIDMPLCHCKLFSIEQAQKILKFVCNQIWLVDFFIVHCEAGISRSAGVAAALSKIYNKDDNYIFNCGKYYPNRHVYRTILEEYYNNEGKY